MKKLLFISFVVLFGYFCFCRLFSQAQSCNEFHILTPGIGYDSVKIGETTLKDIVNIYGKDFKTDTFYTTIYSDETELIPMATEIYSIEISYDSIGVGFYFHPKQEAISSISVYAPFKAKTKEGIILNQSTFNDIVNIYGEQEWIFSVSEKNEKNNVAEKMKKEYNGITFSQEFGKTLPVSKRKLLPYLNNKVTSISISQKNN